MDDHEIMRDGLREVLERSGAFEIEAGDGETAVRVAQSVKPDVVIMDVMMPVKSGVDACREITETLPDTKVLILTAASEEDAVMEALTAGRCGIPSKILRQGSPLRAVGDVGKGEYRMPADAIRRVICGMRMAASQQPNPTGAGDPHTVARGQSYAKIAGLGEPLTIRNAIYSIQDKLGIETKQELVVWAVRSGLLDAVWCMGPGEGPN